MTVVRHPVTGPFERVFLDCSCDGEGRTKQQFSDECNINNIIDQFLGSGQITHVNPNDPVFAEMPDIDFTEATRLVTAAKQRMDQLPSSLREKFGNDPARLLNYIADRDENYDEGVELGVYAPEEEQSPIEVTIAGGEPAVEPAGEPAQEPT